MQFLQKVCKSDYFFCLSSIFRKNNFLEISAWQMFSQLLKLIRRHKDQFCYIFLWIEVKLFHAILYPTLLCDGLHTEQFIYTTLSHTCLDTGCFMVFKHTISCQLLYLHSSCFCCKCFLLTLEETSIAPCALLVRTKITQLLVTSNMLSLQTYKADILSKYCRGSFTLLKINNTCFKDLLFHWNFVFKWKKK